MRLELFLRKFAIYAAAFVIPPIILGTLLTFSTITDLMIHKEPDPLPLAELAQAPPPPGYKVNKPVALIATSNSGTQVTDLLTSYAVLAASDEFQVYTVAQERKLSATTGKVAFLPDFTIKNAPSADLLVITAMTDDTDRAMIDWIRHQALNAKWVLSLGEGARLLAKTGLLVDRKVTSHFLAIEALREIEPRANWVTTSSYLSDGKFISSEGIAVSADATLYALEKYSGPAIANETAERLGLARSPEEPRPASRSLRARDFFQMFMHAGYGWHKQELGVVITPAMDEIALASVLDVLPRTFHFRLHTISSKRRVFETKYGLNLVATESLEKPPIFDMLLLQNNTLADDPEFAQWLDRQRAPSKIYAEEADRPFEAAIDLAQELGVAKSEGIIELVRLLIGHPSTAREASPLLPWFGYRPLMIGFVGMFFVWLAFGRKKKTAA